MASNKNCVTTYLEDDVFFTLKEYAQEQKISQSKAVEKLLRLFFVNRENPIQTIDVSSQVESQVPSQVPDLEANPKIMETIEAVYTILLNKIEILEKAFHTSLEIYSNSQVESQVPSQAARKEPTNRIPDNCRKAAIDLIIAEYKEDGTLIGYSSQKGNSLSKDLDKAYIYSRYDSAIRSIKKWTALSPSRIFRILSKYEVEHNMRLS